MSQEITSITLDKAIATIVLGTLQVLANVKVLDEDNVEVPLDKVTDSVLDCINILVNTAVGKYSDEQIEIILTEYEDTHNSNLIYDVKDAMAEITGISE